MHSNGRIMLASAMCAAAAAAACEPAAQARHGEGRTVQVINGPVPSASGQSTSLQRMLRKAKRRG